MNGGRQGYQKSDLELPWQHGMKARQGEARLPEAQVPFPSRSGEGVGNIIGAGFAEVLAGCGAFEWVALGYLAVSSALIVIFSENLGHPLRLLSVQALVGCMIVALCRAEANVWRGTPKSRVEELGIGSGTLTQRFWHFWRHWYPHLFFLFCFEELGALVHMVLPRWQDAKLIAFDHWLTGVHPAIWLEQFATTGRNEFMQFAYLTYFVYLLVLGGILYYREDWHGYWSVMTYSAVAYAIGYVIAIFFPIESPWFAMAGSWHGELHGGPFTADQFYRALWTRAGCGVSFGACCGVVCGAVGCLAAPAMVVLGDAAAGVVHVRFYSVGALSLCSGYFWRNRYGDAGLCDWEMDYENARAA